ncbi:MAG: SAM-dependent methyltransferase [Christensenellaceae bacterium]|jgi:cyclopropane fatty-acyl-phospholipid synthase-like methyltransferase
MKQPYTDQFNKEFLLQTMMGPNAMRVAEEMASFLEIGKNDRVLDLGCGMGISSILLAEKCNANVVAADLWIDPTDNHRRFSSLGLDDQIFPVRADAQKGLPFAHGYFDILFSVDSYHYYGNNEQMLPSLVPFVKKGGHIAVAVPGLKKDLLGAIPEELAPYWVDDMNFYTCDWWADLFSKTPAVKVEVCREMDVCKQAWDEWLLCDNPYAKNDIDMMRAEGGNYFNLVQIIAKVL